MPFFAPLPEPEPAPEEHKPGYFYIPGQRPQHWVPGTGPAGALLARSATTAVVLHVTGSYPQGLALTVQLLFHPEHTDDVPWRPVPRYRPPREGLRLGMQWADGRRVEADTGRGPEEGPGPEGFRLVLHGGGGGGLEWLWSGWLWPLPPAEPVDVYVEWSRRGIPETRTEIDLTPVVRWADHAAELWPLPGPPEDTGWIGHQRPL
jgi:hypothetical protein